MGKARTEGKRVVVIGAGIAGLTAAHELVERGFEVEVVDSDAERDLHDGWRVRVGGMARTQWAAAPVPPERRRGGPRAFARRMRRLYPVTFPAPVQMKLHDGAVPSDFGEVLEEFVEGCGTLRWPALSLQWRVRAESVGASTPAAWDEEEARLERYLANRLAARKSEGSGGERDRPSSAAAQLHRPEEAPHARPASAAHLQPWIDALTAELRAEGAVDLAIDVSLVAAEEQGDDRQLVLSVLHDQIPAEHGFRFFPSFYRHLFDTMKRIPVQRGIPMTHVDRPRFRYDSEHTIYDNLVPAQAFRFGLAAERGRSFSVRRRPAESVLEVREHLANVLLDAGYDARSVARLAHKLLQFLATCGERRSAELEAISWQDYLGLDALDERLAAHVRSAPQALAAMSAEQNDARTIAAIGLQLMLDQFRETGYVDGTLNGPTSEAMLWHWHAYLRSEGVVFTPGWLLGFCGVPRNADPVVVRPMIRDFDGRAIAPADYYVVTIPVDRFQRLFTADGQPAPIAQLTAPVTAERRAAGSEGRLDPARCDELEREAPRMSRAELLAANRATLGPEAQDDVARYLGFPIGDPSRSPRRDAGPLRHMVGLQFFFEADVKMIKGHVMCSDSAWGISYLSQAQYWRQKRRMYDGYRGVVSVIVTRFDAPGTHAVRKPAWECTPDELATEVWAQIGAGLDDRERAELPEPLYYYIDENIVFSDEGPIERNELPYLVNHVDQWHLRPGRRDREGGYHYDLQLGGVAFAGVFMRTHTRLTTMESANESARRAVNAVLDAEGSMLMRCRTWNLEDDELADFEPLRELDRRLFARGAPHAMEGRWSEAWLRAVPWNLARLLVPSRRGGGA